MIRSEIRSILANKNLIFCITTGRSGTEYLSQLLRLTDDTDSLHEPIPSFDTLFQREEKTHELLYMWMEHAKLPSIASYTGRNYAETSHLTCKGFIETLIECSPSKPKFIILEREKRSVALSMYQLQDIPFLAKRTIRWYLSPARPKYNFTLLDKKLMSDSTLRTKYSLCYWYTLEIAARANYYEKVLKENGFTVYRINTDGLKDFALFSFMLNALDLTISKENIEIYEQIKGIKTNCKTGRKKSSPLVPDNLDTIEEEVKKRTIYKEYKDINFIGYPLQLKTSCP
jgi:hypothetical protein